MAKNLLFHPTHFDCLPSMDETFNILSSFVIRFAILTIALHAFALDLGYKFKNKYDYKVYRYSLTLCLVSKSNKSHFLRM